MTQRPVLEIAGVSHSYGRFQAVGDIDLKVEAGEVACLVGPSGCGKSTVLRLSAGLEAVQQGSIAMHGEIVGSATSRHVPPEDRHVGLVFQDFALFPHLTVAENVGFGLEGLTASDKDRRVMETLRQVGLHEMEAVFPHALSGGQQQRVALARALAPKPGLMLMDEPFSGLDERLREQVRDETLRVLRRHGAATLLVTHDPVEAMFMADRIYLMREGRIIQVGDPQSIYFRPESLFAAQFFSAVNEFPGERVGDRIETALGAIAVGGQATPQRPIVAFRPESVTIGGSHGDDGGLSAQAFIEEVNFMGADWRVRLSVPVAGRPSIQLIARSVAAPPETGNTVRVAIPVDRLFVFERQT